MLVLDSPEKYGSFKQFGKMHRVGVDGASGFFFSLPFRVKSLQANKYCELMVRPCISM